ncbi:PP2C family protein-serine/threonine phosphatase [Arthrobacter sp. ISL-30]|uniref:PP2C family protein-serine/threonine phosphatase n=1 Tax=Arthrobacter sp. ISL-30 TaxID=2819109 RepID=UPI001BE7FE0C|nr:SpoIIE family protein phosphatase [Arthrobacter sp. ISL-30]MBT2513149.1 SpoIIE family protein phosphatase [Arthrobacter sp. ISL-30]
MPASPGTRCAVVIEDDPDVRGLLVLMLKQLDFDVVEATNGLDGIQAVRESHAALVTLDLGLPDIDGLEVCRRLREFSDAYIMMLTARVDEITRLTGLDTGADDYVNKPFSLKEIQARIRAMLRRSRATPTVASDELFRAAEVQQSLLPKEAVMLDDYDVAGSFRPSRSVGGDFYDWYQTPEGLQITFADAMGKGMGAALIAATVRVVMRSVAGRAGIDSAFRAASASIAADLEQSGSFVTLFHARLTAATGRVSYIDAGHGLALHLATGGSVHRLPAAGPPVGVWDGQQWPAAEVDLAPGDSLVVVSDGVLDSFETLEDFMKHVEIAVRAQPTADLACQAVLDLAPADSAGDDVTALIVRRLGTDARQPAGG